LLVQQKAAVHVARRSLGLDDNQRLESDIRGCAEYHRAPVEGEALFEELSRADRAELRRPLLDRALRMAGATHDELPLLGISALADHIGEPDALLPSARTLVSQLLTAGLEERPDVLRLRFLVSEIDDDHRHSDAYTADLVIPLPVCDVIARLCDYSGLCGR
jgi:hypothetical protein